MQVLYQIQFSVVIETSYNQSWRYRSDFNTLLLSITVSVSLQSTTVHTDTVNDIENNLRVNTSSIIPSGYVLTNEGFMVSAFQPNSKYMCMQLQSSTLHYISNIAAYTSTSCICYILFYMLFTYLVITQCYVCALRLHMYLNFCLYDHE